MIYSDARGNYRWKQAGVDYHPDDWRRQFAVSMGAKSGRIVTCNMDIKRFLAGEDARGRTGPRGHCLHLHDLAREDLLLPDGDAAKRMLTGTL